MPPAIKYSKQDIIDVAFKISQSKGFNSINARSIAKELNCSVQPIFHNFSNMEELKKEVYNKIYHTYQEYMLNGSTQPYAYKKMGLAYIKFARDYPEFFKILFMQETDLKAEEFISIDEIGDSVIKKGQAFTKLTYEEQKKFHVQVFIFTHGLASLIATNTCHFTENEISKLLGETVQEMLEGYKKIRKEEKKNEK